jgi:hypothetical protein
MAISLKTHPGLGTGACNPSVSVENGTPLLQDKSHVGRIDQSSLCSVEILGVLSCSMYGYAITFNAAALYPSFLLHLAAYFQDSQMVAE